MASSSNSANDDALEPGSKATSRNSERIKYGGLEPSMFSSDARDQSPLGMKSTLLL